jgi:hypothetical protein
MCEDATPIRRDLLEEDAQYAFTFADDEETEVHNQGYFWDEYWQRNGWQNEQLPARLLRNGLRRAYVFNKECRALVALYRIERSRVFTFTSMADFAREVWTFRQAAGTSAVPRNRRLEIHILAPGSAAGPGIDDPDGHPGHRKKWVQVEARCNNAERPCTGVVFCARLIRVLNPCLRLQGDFPRIGWCNLRGPNFGMSL